MTSKSDEGRVYSNLTESSGKKSKDVGLKIAFSLYLGCSEIYFIGA